LKNNKQSGQLYTLAVRREKIKKKQKQKQLITSGNSNTISLHAPHYVKEDMAAHPERQWMTRFDHRVVSQAPPE
jgi:endonuclease IV